MNLVFLTPPLGRCRGAGYFNGDNMSKKQQNQIREAILTAAKKAGIKNANQFGNLCVKIGVLVKSHAVAFYNEQNDISARKAAVLLEYFNILLTLK